MLQYIFYSLLSICVTTHAQYYDIWLQYDEPAITLTWTKTSPDVTSILFHYGVEKGTDHTAWATSTGTSWVYHGSLTTSSRDRIYTYAEFHYSNGLVVTGPRTVKVLGNRAVVDLPPGGRRIRGVTFRDDFDSYNHNSWTPEVSMFGGMNWEFQVYTPDDKNIYASGGNLFLHPTLTVDDPRFNENFLHHGVMDVAKIWGYCTNDGNYGCLREGQYGMLPPVMSGKVSSVPTLRFGTVEVRAKIPKGDWLWPAIWLLPRANHYGGWPASGEIDIMESRGNGGDLGVNTVSSTLHWGPAWDQNRWSLTHGERHAGDFHADFHTWRLDWTQDNIKIYVDNQLILDVEADGGFWAKGGFSGNNLWASGSKMAPFDQDFFLILNVAVGGTNGFFADDANWGVRKPWANNSPHAAEDFWNGRGDWLPTWQGDNTAMIVDYVEFRN